MSELTVIGINLDKRSAESSFLHTQKPSGGNQYIFSASFIYCISCIITVCVPSVAGAFVGRFIAGFMSAVPSIIVSGSIEDIFNMQQRVGMMFVWACATSGLLLGPIYGTYISHSLGWCVSSFYPSWIGIVKLNPVFRQALDLLYRNPCHGSIHLPPVLAIVFAVFSILPVRT